MKVYQNYTRDVGSGPGVHRLYHKLTNSPILHYLYDFLLVPVPVCRAQLGNNISTFPWTKTLALQECAHQTRVHHISLDLISCSSQKGRSCSQFKVLYHVISTRNVSKHPSQEYIDWDGELRWGMIGESSKTCPRRRWTKML